ncbi:hypothetical protein D8666_21040 [Ochrobactrum soli]|uniref:Uncharacterized protein n=1 Tax=Ochrobactrum soli TaxID=2448455 RepID=A0A849KTP5_9HYPH|nr:MULTISPECIES: hypothetical protein [Brucella]WHT44310.1 hypothetical protein QLQ11_21000 [Ochrobactrum sp. SSR]NNU63187.1 hypothetical protein [[Ochrobactrum] soli]RLL65532.1 hypothetical protein D8666_21040 [[Ochrobactrum] soli]WHS30022.1 hypothetical protein QLQ09_00005 [Brucella sp. NM4]WHS30205.1 hypothetical protein QLQ09_01045 [Brucella sp. NM4]
MPFFNEASRVYNTIEVTFLRSCYTNAAIILEESDQNYSAHELASCIILLYERGLRDQSYISELAANLAHLRYSRRHQMDRANSNNLFGTFA